MVEQRQRRTNLLYHPLVEYGDAIAGGQSLFLVVGDKQGGDVEPALQFFEFLAGLQP